VAVFAALAIGLSLLGRAIINGTPDILALADRTIPITVSLNSPVDFVLTKLAEISSRTSTETFTRLFSAGFFISASMSLLLAALLWIFKWPFGRKEFNLWANLPTFTPAEVSLTGRRLRRAGSTSCSAACCFMPYPSCFRCYKVGLGQTCLATCTPSYGW